MASGWEEVYKHSLDCVHCGLCLSSCPTYRETGRETSSPRGRIYLLRGVAEGRIAAENVFEETYRCLGCRACETACPSGVNFGPMLELARAQIESAGLRSGWPKRIEQWALRGLIPRRRRLSLAIGLLSLIQGLGLDRLLASLLPDALRELHSLLPAIPPARERRRLPALTPALGAKRGRVAFFAGCVMPELFGAVNMATVRVLARNGFEVVSPPAQGCCGALHAHAGDLDFARDLARRNLAAFANTQVDAVIVNSAGCGAALKELDGWLPGQAANFAVDTVTGFADDSVARFAASVRDVSEFLDAQGIRPPSARIEARVCYDDPCHLVHGQRISAAPRSLLEQIPGVTLVEHDDPTACCGAAGIYNLTHPAMSRAVLERKLKTLAAAQPDIVATGNPGCLMQLRSGVSRGALQAEILHPIELLDRSYRG